MACRHLINENQGGVGAILTQQMMAKLIANKIHVNPELYQQFSEIKGNRIVLIRDSMRTGGISSGIDDLEDEK